MPQHHYSYELKATKFSFSSCGIGHMLIQKDMDTQPYKTIEISAVAVGNCCLLAFSFIVYLRGKRSSGVVVEQQKLFVSGLSFSTTEENFRKCFSRFGQLVEAKIIIDRFAKRSKGFGFIEYATAIEAQEAILGMDGKFLDGRVIFVEIARPKLTRPSLPRATGPPKILRDTIELIERSQ